MNLIKLKDVIMPQNEISEFYNKYLKGKYAYWIHMRYIVPFDLMSKEGYIAVEENINKLLKTEDGTFPEPYGCQYIDIYNMEDCECDIMRYIDLEETEHINNIGIYIYRNNNAVDIDLTIGQIKMFRKWFAQTLLNLNNDFDLKLFDDSIIHMLTYYANDMMNDVIKYLNMFSNTEKITVSTTSLTCNCCNNINNTPIELNNINTIKLYRNNIYNKMVNTFSNIDFWLKLDKSFIEKTKQYIDNILRLGLKVNNNFDQKVSLYNDCNCDSFEVNNNENILKRLSESLNYILNNQTDNHKNFIKTSLYNWSSMLYEYMYW